MASSREEDFPSWRAPYSNCLRIFIDSRAVGISISSKLGTLLSCLANLRPPFLPHDPESVWADLTELEVFQRVELHDGSRGVEAREAAAGVRNLDLDAKGAVDGLEH